MKRMDLPTFIKNNYEIHEWRHACAILRQDFKHEYQDVCDVLMRFRLKKSHMGKLIPRIQGGGGAGCPLLVFGIRRTLYDEDI